MKVLEMSVKLLWLYINNKNGTEVDSESAAMRNHFKDVTITANHKAQLNRTHCFLKWSQVATQS